MKYKDYKEEQALLAYRLLYYCYGRSLISDREYDTRERNLLELVPESELGLVGSDCVEHYSLEVQVIAAKLLNIELDRL